MKFREKRIEKLKQVLAPPLSRGEIVQNRRLKTLLGAVGYAGYCEEYREKAQLRKMLGDKSKELVSMNGV